MSGNWFATICHREPPVNTKPGPATRGMDSGACDRPRQHEGFGPVTEVSSPYGPNPSKST